MVEFYFPECPEKVQAYAFYKADLNGDKWVGEHELSEIFLVFFNYKLLFTNNWVIDEHVWSLGSKLYLLTI